MKNRFLALSLSLDVYSLQSEYFIVFGDFNVEVKLRDMEEFCNNYDLKRLIRVPASYKNPDNPTCIDLILTNYQISSNCPVQ